MKSNIVEQSKSGSYKVGLNSDHEAVISAHFMHSLHRDSTLSVYSPLEFSRRALSVSHSQIFENLIPSILEASEKFIEERATAAKMRAKENFREYGLKHQSELSISEIISEIMFDRQFLKGHKSNYSRLVLSQQIKKLIEQGKPIKMVIPALPYKVSSPLKSRGLLPDLSEVNFILGLIEIAQTIEFVLQDEKMSFKGVGASFIVICDGSRFNTFLNEPSESISQYQHQLTWWINKLNKSKYISLIDYKALISNYLPKELQDKKNITRKKIQEQYTKLMSPILDFNNMSLTLRKAIELDPDPEECNAEGRFIPLFKSLIYIIKYKTLLEYTNRHDKDYYTLYSELTRHIFEPYAILPLVEKIQISKFILNPQTNDRPQHEHVLEYLRQSMLEEAWNATINYISEIRSDRDLQQDPILACLPDYIRWTIHAKPGQLAILTTTASGDPVQPWHGVGVFKLSKNKRIKLYTLPIFFLEGIGATPFLFNENAIGAEEFIKQKQPLFYVHPNIHFKTLDDLFENIKNNITRKRKF